MTFTSILAVDIMTFNEQFVMISLILICNRPLNF